MATDVLQLVNELVAQGKWDDAHAMLMQHAAQTPNDPRLEYEIGVLCYNMGRYEEAEIHLKTSLSIFFDSQESHYHLGLTLLKQDRAQEAMPEFREACERKPGFAVGHLHWGLALAAMGSLKGALGQFNQATKLNPNLAAAHYQAGLMNYMLGQHVEAIKSFQSACGIEPSMAESYNALGVTHLAMGNYSEAVQGFERAWQLDNTQPIVKRNLAAALVKQGNLDEAVKHYQDAVTLPSRNMSAKDRAHIYNDWAVNLFRQARLDEAAEKLLHAVDVDPSFIDAQVNLGLVRTSMQEYELASEAFEKALEAHPNAKEIEMYLGVSYLFLGQYDKALEKLTQLKNKGTVSPELDLWLAYAHVALGHMDEAELFFDSAAKEGSSSYLALDGLGCCLALRQKHDQAAAKFRQCLAVRPDHGLGHLHLARSLEELGQTAQATAEYKEALMHDPSCLAPEKEATEKLIQASQFEAAMAKAIKLLNIAPADVDAKLSLARALKAQNKTDEAGELLIRIVETHPNNGPARVLLGQLYLGAGRFAEADEMFRTASELFDGDTFLYYYWGKTLSLLGLHELALEKYSKASEIDPYEADVYDAWGQTLKLLGRYADAAGVYKRAAEYI